MYKHLKKERLKTMNDNHKSIDYRLKLVMQKKNLKQRDILERSKPFFKGDSRLSKATLSTYVNGKANPRQDKLYILARALDVAPQWLMGFGEDEPILSYQEDSSKNDNESKKLTWKDFGQSYGGDTPVPDEFQSLVDGLAEGYIKSHPEIQKELKDMGLYDDDDNE